MGGRHSKRSVDISGGSKEGDEAQPLDGKLEKLEEGPKMAVNGASHSEHKASEQLDEQVSNGDPVSLPENMAEEAGPSSPSDERQVESPQSETIQPPKKKEKVKKKWSLRSLSFSKKDKSKPGKDESAKEETEGVPEVTEEKVDEVGTSFISSVSEVITSATEAVGEAVVAAEHKVEEGLTATQDQVEKISAKVAEKAEALVSKMEAMTVQAVDTAQEMIGISHPHSTAVDDNLPAGEEGTATTKVDSSEDTLDTTQSEPSVTNVMVPVPAVVSDLAASGDGVVETVENETTMEPTVTKTEEVPPPLPASPPPTSVTGEVVSEVTIPKQAPATEDTIPEVAGGGDEPQEACESHTPVAMPAVQPSETFVAGDVVTQVVTQVVTEVIETSEQFVATADLSNQALENTENEENVDSDNTPASAEILKKPSETSVTSEDESEPSPEKSAEE